MEYYEEKQTGLADGATEVVTVEEAKAWGVIETSLDDAVITSIIISAREMVESFISKDIVSKNRVVFVDYPQLDDDVYVIELGYPAKSDTVTVTSGTTTLTEGTHYDLVGIDGRIVKFYSLHKDLKVEYESDPVTSPSELSLAKDATKVLVEQIYDNRGNLEGDSDIQVMDSNVKCMLMPIKAIYM